MISKWWPCWLLLGLSLSTAVAQAPEINQSEALKTFSEVSSSQTKLRKWNKPIQVGVLSSGPTRLRLLEVIGHTFAEIEPLIPAPIHYSTRTTNFAILFIDDFNEGVREYGPVIRHAFPDDQAFRVYVDSIRKNSFACSNAMVITDNHPSFYLILIWLKGQATNTSLENCVARGIASGLGFGKHNASTNSVFNPKLDLHSLSEVDKSVIKSFYSTNFVPGAPRKDAQAAFEKALSAR